MGLVADGLDALVRPFAPVASRICCTASPAQSSIGVAPIVAQPQPVGLAVDDEDLIRAPGIRADMAAISPTGPLPDHHRLPDADLASSVP